MRRTSTSRGPPRGADGYAGPRLQKLLHDCPYLDYPNHFLHEQVQEAKTTIAAGGDVEDLLDRIEAENETEHTTLAAAFRRFDVRGRKELGQHEMKQMSQYLGFPCSDDDVKQLMDAIDNDGSGSINFEEFSEYVGKVGGSVVLFEARRARLSSRHRSGSAGDISVEELAHSLNEAGIDKEAQASWRLVVPPSDFQAASELVRCQKTAVATIRRLAKTNHERALPQLQRKVAGLGYKDNDLWMTLAWIREMAPVLVHVNLDKMLQFMENDTHYRNQFETGASGGLLNTDVRKKWERDLFQSKYDSANGFDRPKYGVQNVMNDYRGVVKCAQYGDSYMILKDVRLRCTFSPEDSANLKADRLAVLDFYAHVLNEYSNDELVETLKVANSKDAALLGDSDKVGKMKYKEAQIHGEVRFDRHVERLVVHMRHRARDGARIQAVCRKHGWVLSWMDEEQRRMREEDMHKLGGEAWAERLRLLQESGAGGDVEVAEGCCKQGCGRPVAPGVTRSGKPYTTCCRGCVMGFGHDLTCGTIDASKVGPGLCKQGCGRPVAAGTDSKGRALTTCCRSCALGLGTHDARCGSDAPSVSRGSTAAGSGALRVMCKKDGCGRSGAPGTTRSGKPFDTCCRGCATGGTCTAECDARADAEGTR